VSGRSRLTGLARELRKRSTDAERTLWRYLRARQLGGLKFRRQEPIGQYVVDFVCYEKRLVIEVDGGHHALRRDEERARDQWLEGQGFCVLRLLDNDVLTNLAGVLELVHGVCEERAAHHEG
jgi:very-short-patch-repair endonuclease